MPLDVDLPRTGQREGCVALDTFVDAVSEEDAVGMIVRWAQVRQSRAIYFCNVHSLVTARSNTVLWAALSAGDVLTPDGWPVAWLLRCAGFKGQQRISGPDLMPKPFAAGEKAGLSVFFYGEQPSTLSSLRGALARDFPSLSIAGMFSPPFREPTFAEDCQIVNAINASRAHIVFVALGCPKQEKWIAAHKGRVNAPMLGVGAAFAFFAGVKPRGPAWMQKLGLEWLYRLTSEPRRLAPRYLVTNAIFILSVLRDSLAGRLSSSAESITVTRKHEG
jgi:N-acetylglucosaminyldiphosphoundecaprenol N-acetyl-beta-D-mannosaminyltransferase